MAWKPWYERMAEIDSADERAEFLRGVFGGPKPIGARQVADAAIVALMVGWGTSRIIKAATKK